MHQVKTALALAKLQAPNMLPVRLAPDGRHSAAQGGAGTVVLLLSTKILSLSAWDKGMQQGARPLAAKATSGFTLDRGTHAYSMPSSGSGVSRMSKVVDASEVLSALNCAGWAQAHALVRAALGMNGGHILDITGVIVRVRCLLGADIMQQEAYRNLKAPVLIQAILQVRS